VAVAWCLCYIHRNEPSQIAKPSVPCCHMSNKNEGFCGLVTVIPLFTKLFWFLLLLTVCVLMQVDESSEASYGSAGHSNVYKPARAAAVQSRPRHRYVCHICYFWLFPCICKF